MDRGRSDTQMKHSHRAPLERVWQQLRDVQTHRSLRWPPGIRVGPRRSARPFPSCSSRGYAGPEGKPRTLQAPPRPPLARPGIAGAEPDAHATGVAARRGARNLELDVVGALLNK